MKMSLKMLNVHIFQSDILLHIFIKRDYPYQHLCKILSAKLCPRKIVEKQQKVFEHVLKTCDFSSFLFQYENKAKLLSVTDPQAWVAQ